MSRAEAKRLWQRIADGALEQPPDDCEQDDLHAWLRGVATKLLEADTLPDGLRPGETLRAVGLFGRKDPDADLRDELTLMDEFEMHGEDGQPRETKRRERMANFIDIARERRPAWFELTDDDIRKRLERLLAARRKV